MPIMLLICCYNHESPPDIHYLKRHKYDKCYQCSPSDKISQKWCFMINLWIESRENCNKTATVTRHFSNMYLYKIFNEKHWVEIISLDVSHINAVIVTRLSPVQH